jgi:RecA-family ATPase
MHGSLHGAPVSKTGPKMNPQNIPKEFQNYPQWVCHDEHKRPINPHTGLPASVTDPTTWGTADQAQAAVDAGKGVGTGFVLTATDPFACIDLDACIAPDGTLTPFAQEIGQGFNSWTERSRSGRGLHVWIKGAVPGGGRRISGVEVYSEGRFIAMTGDVFNGGSVENRAELLPAFIDKYFPKPKAEGFANSLSRLQTRSDDEVLAACRSATNGVAFAELEDGKHKGASEGGAGFDHSAADQAFVNYLWFHSQNTEQVVRLWQASKLGQRSKAQRADYIQRTLNKAADQSFAHVAHNLPNPFAIAPQSDTLSLPEILQLVEKTPPRLFTTTFLTPVGEVTLLSANGGVGKTMFALIWSICITFGIAGLPVQITKAAPVLFVTAEDTAIECGRRLKAIFEALHLNMAGAYANEGSERFNLWDVDGAPLWVESRETPAGTATPALIELERRIAATGAKQVFIDNASSVFHANHNDLTAVNAFIGALRRIAARTDCNIVLLAHVSAENATKGTAKTYYGSAAWHNGVRSRMFMEAKPAENGIPEHIVVVHEKSNYGPKAEPFKMKRHPETGVLSSFSNSEIAAAIDEDLAPFVEQVFAHIAEATKRNEPIRTATSGPRTAFHCLADLFPKHYRDNKEQKRKLALAISQLSESGRIVKRDAYSNTRNPFQKWVVLAPDDPLYGKGV